MSTILSAPSLHDKAFALYHLPHSPHYSYVAGRGDALPLRSLADIGGGRGVVIAPFQASAANPLLFIQADEEEHYPLPTDYADIAAGLQVLPPSTDGFEEYQKGFAECLRRLHTDNALRKVVYARQLTYPLAGGDGNAIDAHALFIHACHRHPHSYVTLWYTPTTGLWLVATPETLIAADADRWRTMALAGTTSWCEDDTMAWSNKNKQEQAYVAEYILGQLGELADDIRPTEVYSRRAARHLMHLCTDITFRLRRGVTLGAVVGRLHPTPAVCGDSLMAARCAIRAAERAPRRYYAGFSGPIGLETTALFVSLRCMSIVGNTATLYAGGGLLAESILEDEWEETCRKMQPVQELLTVSQ